VVKLIILEGRKKRLNELEADKKSAISPFCMSVISIVNYSEEKKKSYYPVDHILCAITLFDFHLNL